MRIPRRRPPPGPILLRRSRPRALLRALLLLVCLTRLPAAVAVVAAPQTSPSPSANFPAATPGPIDVLPYERITPLKLATQAGMPRDTAAFASNLTRLLNVLTAAYPARHALLRARCAADPAFAARTRLLVFRGDNNYGLGDRVRGMLHAYMLAVMTDRLLLLDQPEPFALSRVLVSPPGHSFWHDPRLFHPVAARHETPTPHPRVLVSDSAFHFPQNYTRAARTIVHYRMPTFVVGNLLGHAEHFPHFRAALERTGLLDFVPSTNALAPFLLQAMLRPGRRLRSLMREHAPFAADRAAAAKAVPFAPVEYLSAHARLGKGLGEGGVGRFNLTVHRLTTRQLARCLGRAAGRGAKARGLQRVFVATDTVSEQGAILRGVHETLPGATVEFARGAPVHVGELSKRAKSGRNFAKFETTLLHVALLARGKSVVHLPSGFVNVAIWLGAITDATVVQPTNCLRDLNLTTTTTKR